MLLIGVGESGERTAKIAQALEIEVIALRHNSIAASRFTGCLSKFGTQ